MLGLISPIREPVRRAGAERYLLITLLAFASSVVLIRIFLHLTDYPQLGGSRLHVAHVLWGGLLLFVASLLPLIFANRWVYLVGALLSGIGVGLFIDEVGKFITTTNDYFHPAAAPIIYAFFMLTVLLYLQVRRRPPHEPRAELVHDLDVLTEALDHDVEPYERADLEAGLRQVAREAPHPEIARLAQDLLAFLTSDSLRLRPETPPMWDRALDRIRALEARYLGRRRLKTLLVVGFGLLGMSPLTPIIPPLVRAYGLPEVNGDLLAALLAAGQVTNPRAGGLLATWLTVGTLAGVVMLLATVHLIAGHDRRGIELGHLGLLLFLSAVNLLLFYFDQFEAVGGAVFQFVLLMGALHYRRRYLSTPDEGSPTDGDPHPSGRIGEAATDVPLSGAHPSPLLSGYRQPDRHDGLRRA